MTIFNKTNFFHDNFKFFYLLALAVCRQNRLFTTNSSNPNSPVPRHDLTTDKSDSSDGIRALALR